MKNRAEMMKRVQQLGFVMFDVSLYLNNHPYDQAALNLFSRYRALAEEAQKEYEAAFGPISRGGVNVERDGWSWINQPWPWEVED